MNTDGAMSIDVVSAALEVMHLGGDNLLPSQMRNEHSDIDYAERRIAASIIVACAETIASSYLRKTVPSWLSGQGGWKQIRADEVRWIAGDGKSPISFLECCNVLGIEPTILRARFTRLRGMLEELSHELKLGLRDFKAKTHGDVVMRALYGEEHNG